MSAKFIKSSKGKELIVYVGNIFEKDDITIGLQTRRQIRRHPTFSLELWIPYDAELLDLPKN